MTHEDDDTVRAMTAETDRDGRENALGHVNRDMMLDLFLAGDDEAAEEVAAALLHDGVEMMETSVRTGSHKITHDMHKRTHCGPQKVVKTKGIESGAREKRS